jgi:hypothetical protein
MTAAVRSPPAPRGKLTGGEAARFPVVIAEWPRDPGKIVRIALDRFNERFVVDIRCWWRDKNGVFRPGRDGLTLTVKHLPKLADALGNAFHRAEMFGLIEPVRRTKPRLRDGKIGTA